MPPVVLAITRDLDTETLFCLFVQNNSLGTDVAFVPMPHFILSPAQAVDRPQASAERFQPLSNQQCLFGLGFRPPARFRFGGSRLGQAHRLGRGAICRAIRRKTTFGPLQ